MKTLTLNSQDAQTTELLNYFKTEGTLAHGDYWIESDWGHSIFIMEEGNVEVYFKNHIPVLGVTTLERYLKVISSRPNKRTKLFQFPNNGHSIRKLARYLEELTKPVEMIVEPDNQYGGDDFFIYFKEMDWEDSGRATGVELAAMLKAKATRFSCQSYDTYTTKELDGSTSYSYTANLEFHTDLMDLMCNPDVYKA